MTIPIRNLYYLLCYAWRRLPESGVGDQGSESGSDMANMFARFLSHGFLRQIRRGLDRAYLDRVEESASLRGRGLWLETKMKQSLTRGQIVCEFQELGTDTKANRIVKSAFRLLLNQAQLEIDLRRRVRACLNYLEEVPDMELSEDGFRSIQLHGGLREYAWMLDACHMLARLRMPGPAGVLRFKEILRDEKLMSRVFEEFIRGFYDLTQSEFKLGRRVLKWPWEPADEVSSALLPTMQTDITLVRNSEVIVIDTKYYGRTLSTPSQYSKEAVHSGNLYQMQAYLAAHAKLGARPLKGVLLYPKVDRDLDVLYRHDDYTLRAATIDLSLPWESIHFRLLDLLK